MKFFAKENLPYQQKLVMVFAIIITMFFAIGFSACTSQASTWPEETKTSGPLSKRLEAQAEILTVKLLGVTSYELTVIFSDILETTPGIVKARRGQLHLAPKHPPAGIVEWQVTFSNTTPFAIESAIYNHIKEITDNNVTTYLTNGFTINLTNSECAALKAIQPGQSTGQSLCFIETNVFTDNSLVKWHHNYPRAVSNWRIYPNRGFE
jgi:hypothetical protein